MTARLWDATTGEPAGEPLSDCGAVMRATFSPDGKYLLTTGVRPDLMNITSRGLETRLWDATTGKALGQAMNIGDISRLNINRPVAQFSPDGTRVLTTSTGGTARVWEVPSGKLVGEPLKCGGDVTLAEFSPDGRRVLTADNVHAVRVWDAGTGQPLTPLIKHTATVNAASFSPDGSLVLTACEDGATRLWRIDRRLDMIRDSLKPVTGIATSLDGRRVLCISRDDVRVRDATTGEPVGPPISEQSAVRTAVLSPDGKRVLILSSKKTVRLCDIATGEDLIPPLQILYDASFTTGLPQFSPDGRCFAVVSGRFPRTDKPEEGEEGVVQVWFPDGDSTHESHITVEKTVTSFAFSPDSKRLLVVTRDNLLRLYDPRSGEARSPALPHSGQSGPIVGKHMTLFTPDSQRVLTLDKGQVTVWDVSTSEPRAYPQKQISGVQHAGFSPNGRCVITSSGQAARVWNWETGEPVGPELKHASSVSFAAISPDGRRVATASADRTARVWDIETGTAVTPSLQHGDGVTFAAFSPDSRRVVTTSQDKTARVWDAATGEALSPPLSLYPLAPNAAAFSGDGRFLVIKPAFLWDLSPDDRPVEDLLHLAHALAGRRIDAAGGASGLAPLDSASFRGHWETFRAKHPSDASHRTTDLAAFLEREAAKAETAMAWSVAVLHLDRLMAMRPDDQTLLSRRAQANLRGQQWDKAVSDFTRLIERGDADWHTWESRGTAYAVQRQWDKAAADFAAAIDHGADDLTVWHQLATLRLATNDPAGYRQVCTDLLTRYGDSDNPTTQNKIVETCTLGPNALDDPNVIADLAQKLVAANPKSRSNLAAVGAALYRAGKLEVAVGRLKEAIAATPTGDNLEEFFEFPGLAKPSPKLSQLPKGGEPPDWIFMAMAQHRLGRTEEAQLWLEKAKWLCEFVKTFANLDKGPMARNWSEPLVFQLMIHEAEALLAEKARLNQPEKQ